MTSDPDEDAPQSSWQKPVIEDFGVEGTATITPGAGIDNYEASNPVGYGVS